jgi:hypothetical protein
MKRCRECKVEKELIDFYKQSRNTDGFNNICIECSKLYYKNLCIKQASDNDSETNILNDEDVCLLLEKIGYDLQSELSVHQQFMMKYNLA